MNQEAVKHTHTHLIYLPTLHFYTPHKKLFKSFMKLTMSIMYIPIHWNFYCVNRTCRRQKKNCRNWRNYIFTRAKNFSPKFINITKYYFNICFVGDKLTIYNLIVSVCQSNWCMQINSNGIRGFMQLQHLSLLGNRNVTAVTYARFHNESINV